MRSADPAAVGALAAAAWHGSPAAALPLLAGLDPNGPHPARIRWLAGVCLGALGRYRTAARWLSPPGGPPPDSAAASCLASHLRQLGRHAAAEPLDQLALATAGDAGARADALVGLVADAIGRLDAAGAVDRLTAAAAEIPAAGDLPAGDPQWRAPVRLAWVTAELALLRSDPETAVAAGRAAERLARRVSACRHAVKSRLVLGASLKAYDRYRTADRVLRAAAAGAVELELVPLAVVVRTLRAEILQVRAPRTAEREREQARSAQSIIEEGSESRIYL